ncbi:MAG: dockerin type I repeat-containing protein [Planctomycetes bacterium]|nr:dockerin type I repeat-containing protein [Planctomycetota bacterium]
MRPVLCVRSVPCVRTVRTMLCACAALAALLAPSDALAAHWARTYYGPGPSSYRAIRMTSDGGSIAVGDTGHPTLPSQPKIVVVKLDPDGRLEWSRTYSQAGAFLEGLVVEEIDGVYVVAGTIRIAGRDGALVMGLEADSFPRWVRVFRDDGFNLRLSAMADMHDGFAAVAGFTDVWGDRDVWVARIEAQSGFTEWQAVLDHKDDEDESFDETPAAIVATSYQTLIVASNYQGPQGDADIWVVELDASGAPMAQIEIHGSGTDGVTSVIEFDPGVPHIDPRFVLTGFTNSDVGPSFGVLLADFTMDPISPVRWARTYRFGGTAYGYGVVQTPNLDLVVAGSGDGPNTSSKEALILRTDPEGNLPSIRMFGDTRWDEAFFSVGLGIGDGVIAGGYTESFPHTGGMNPWAMSLDPFDHTGSDESCMEIDPVGPETRTLDFQHPCYPAEERGPWIEPMDVTVDVKVNAPVSIRLCTWLHLGDVDCNGFVGVGDSICLLDYLFDQPSPTCQSLCCQANADANGDGQVDIADPVRILMYVYSGGQLIEPDKKSTIPPGPDACRHYDQSLIRLPCETICSP